MASSANATTLDTKDIGLLQSLNEEKQKAADKNEQLKRVLVMLQKKHNEVKKANSSLANVSEQLKQKFDGKAEKAESEHFRPGPRTFGHREDECEKAEDASSSSRCANQIVGSAAVALRQARKQIEPVLAEVVEDTTAPVMTMPIRATAVPARAQVRRFSSVPRRTKEHPSSAASEVGAGWGPHYAVTTERATWATASSDEVRSYTPSSSDLAAAERLSSPPSTSDTSPEVRDFVPCFSVPERPLVPKPPAGKRPEIRGRKVSRADRPMSAPSPTVLV